jgi:hypothetical membrane protein
MEVQKNVRLRWAGALLVLAAVQYLVLEAVTAAAWHTPPYNYAVGFISDLGNPVAGDVFEGRVVNSPLHLVMDAAFIGQGVLFITASVLLAGAVAGRLRTVLLTLAVLHGIGVILVGFFHESTAALTNGVIVVHSLGAAATIVAGNVIAIVVGAVGRRWSVPTWLRVAAVGTGVLGLAAFVLLQADTTLYNAAGGVPERIAVYTILLFEAAAGVTVSRRTWHAVAPAIPSVSSVPSERLAS